MLLCFHTRETEMPKTDTPISTRKPIDWPNVAGWVAIVFIQGATVPATVQALVDPSADLPPLSMVMMLWIGLALFLWRGYCQKDRVMVVSNGVGFALQTLLLSIMVFR